MSERATCYSLAIPAQCALGKLVCDIGHPWLRQRIPAAISAQRVATSRTMLYMIGRGDSGMPIRIILGVRSPRIPQVAAQSRRCSLMTSRTLYSRGQHCRTRPTTRAHRTRQRPW